MDRARDAAPATGDDWVALIPGPLPVAEASAWVVRPDCGATVTFTGTARDHAPDRPDVRHLEYEAYEGPALARLDTLVGELRGAMAGHPEGRPPASHRGGRHRRRCRGRGRVLPPSSGGLRGRSRRHR